MFWCQGAQNIELSNRILKSRQADRRTSNERSALITCEARWTITRVAVNAVQARGVVLTLVTWTVIDVCLATITFEAASTRAAVTRHAIAA